jgi:predicted Zn finger-like uncharacterized protein
MKVACPECSSAYNVSDAKIPLKGIYARCPKCGHRFFLEKKATVSDLSKEKSPKLAKQKRTEDNQTQCPKCGLEQPFSKVCAGCGVIFDKVRMLISCPHCGFKQPPSHVCTNCKKEIRKTAGRSKKKKSLGELIKMIQKGGFNEKAKKLIFEYFAENIKATVVTGSIILAIIFVIFLATGRSSLSSLFSSSREIMYHAVFSQCKCTLNGKPCQGINSILFKLKIGNTGDEHLEDVMIDIKNLPYPLWQVYYSVQNLAANNPREFDPVVKIQCEDERQDICPNIHPFRNWIEECGYLTSFTAQCFADMGSVADCENEYSPPCAIQNEARLKVETIASGSLVEIGLMSYEGSEKLNQELFKYIEINVNSDAEVIAEDPQISSLVRLYKSIIDIFF